LKGNLGMAEEIEGRIRTASAAGALVLAGPDSKSKKGAPAVVEEEDDEEI
jgi:hypothetical protein